MAINSERIMALQIEIMQLVLSTTSKAVDPAPDREEMAVRLQLLQKEMAEHAGVLIGTRVTLGFLSENDAETERDHLLDVLTDASWLRRPMPHRSSFDFNAWLPK